MYRLSPRLVPGVALESNVFKNLEKPKGRYREIMVDVMHFKRP